MRDAISSTINYVLGDRERVRPLRLTIPAREPREAVSDIFDLDVGRLRIEQVETAPGQHALLGARRELCGKALMALSVISTIVFRLPAARMRAAGRHKLCGNGTRRGGR